MVNELGEHVQQSGSKEHTILDAIRTENIFLTLETITKIYVEMKLVNWRNAFSMDRPTNPICAGR